jgi:O-antigen/teichoic acid export membrane protein
MPQTVQAAETGARKQVRGSALLLVGRGLALVLNLATQVMMVRYLARDDYGRLTYAFAGVALLSTVTALGLDKALSRFLALYHERGDYPRVFGSLALAGASIAVMGGALAAAFFVFRSRLPGLIDVDPTALDLLAVLLVLAPLNAIDGVTISCYSVFVGARAIFFRRHLMVPLLRLFAVALTMTLGASVRVLALLYAASMLAGAAWNLLLLARMFRRGGHLERWRPRRLVWPVREVFGFSLAILSADMALIAYDSVLVLMLEYFRDPASVAAYQAVRPFARLSEVVQVSFSMLFVPALTRMVARGEEDGVRHLHGENTLWIAVMTFPLFAVTFGLADPLAVIAFGAEYADAGRALAWLSLGYFATAVTSLNLETLKVLGRMRVVMALDLLCAALAVAGGWLLIPAYGAEGAALAVAVALVVDGLLSCWMLHVAAGIPPVSRAHRNAYAPVLAGAVLLVSMRFLPDRSPAIDLIASASALLAVGLVSRRALRILERFPELGSVSLLRRWLA